MLEHNETMVLIQQAKNGDENAKQTLVNENSPLIKSVIKRFINKGIEYDDLFQLGCLGFLKALKNFDLTFNVRFSTYCVPMIIGEVKRFIRDDGAIKVSRAIKSLNMHVNKYIQKYQETHFEKPTLEHIAKTFNVDVQEIIFAMDSARMPLSIYTPLDDDNSKSALLIDRYATISNDEFNNKLVLQELLEGLSTRERKVILLRFYRDKTQSEIAKLLNISQVQVSRLENKILEKLRSKIAK